MGWISHPVFIEEIPVSNISRIVFFDESGSSNLNAVIKNQNDPDSIPYSERFFTLTACVFKPDEFQKAKELIMEAKEKHWANGMYNDKGILKRVIFHSTEIRRRSGAFSDSNLDFSELMHDLDYAMSIMPMQVLSACVNKVALCNKYVFPKEPYDLCLDFIFERLIKFAFPGENFAIVLESRGKNEDRKLLSHIRQLFQKGTNFTNASQYSKVKGVYFNPKWTSDFQKSFLGLEIADLCAYSIYKQFVSENGYASFEIVKKHFYGYPNYLGRGLKIFP